METTTSPLSMWFNVFEILLTITLFLSWKVGYIDEPDTVYDVPINFNTIPTIKVRHQWLQSIQLSLFN